MRNRWRIAFSLTMVLVAPLLVSDAHAAGQSTDLTSTVVCGSKAGERQTCAAANTGNVTLARSLGSAGCELGRTWGFDANGVWVSEGCSGEFSVAAPDPETFGQYMPGSGIKVADTEHGDLSIRLFTYIRYLNQRYTDNSYTNAFGTTTDIQQRQDFQLNKAQVYFLGWLLSRNFRYNAYVWTSNTSLGQLSQVVVAGNLTYRFGDHLTLGGGITGLPGTRSTEGTFPYWLALDTRLIGDEYFRPSYTTALFAEGQFVTGLEYRLAWGNNLSQFGIDAGQLDGGLDTLATGLIWMPTTGEFGRSSGFGDYVPHDRVATRLALHYTRSDENRQGQPASDGFDNVQLRVSDGSVIFAASLFAPGVQIEDATYKMVAVDGGIKYRGYSFDLEFYRRQLDHFNLRGTGVLPFDSLHDHGFNTQASAMILPRHLQAYVGASKIYGEYGDPSDYRVGANVFPWKNEVVRWNFEFLHVKRSPVGATSLPYSVGSNGPILHSSFMVWF